MDTQLMKDLIHTLIQERQAVTTTLADKELSMAELVAMMGIADNRADAERNVYADDLQSSLHVSKPAISQMLKSLEKAGYIRREINESNRRKLDVTLTDEGRAALTKARARYRRTFAQIIDTFGIEKTKQLIALNREFLSVARKTLQNETR